MVERGHFPDVLALALASKPRLHALIAVDATLEFLLFDICGWVGGCVSGGTGKGVKSDNKKRA